MSYAHAFAPPPLASYGADAVAFSGTAKRHNLTISAPGAREMRIWQVNHGGNRHLKNVLKDSTSVKTLRRMKNKRADNPAKVKVRVFWKSDAGGGSEWFGPRSVGSSGQTWRLQSPAARGNYTAPPPSGAAGAEPGGWEAPADEGYDSGWEAPADDPALSYVPDGTGGGYADGGVFEDDSGPPGWLIPAAAAMAIIIPLGAWAIKKSRG